MKIITWKRFKKEQPGKEENRTRTFFFFVGIVLLLAFVGGKYLLNDTAMKEIDINRYKQAIHYAFPIVGVSYQGNTEDAGIAGDLFHLSGNLFRVDFSSPFSIFNKAFPFFVPFYNNGYQKYIDDQNNVLIHPEQELIADDTIIKGEEEDDGTKQGGQGSSDTPEKINFNSITIDNRTGYKIDINQMLNEPLNIGFDKKKSKILIYHTHTTEGYLRSLDQINQNIPGRTRNAELNVVKVGEDLTTTLKKKYGFNAIHNATIHDADYNQAYEKAGNTLLSIVKGDESVNLVFDVHRDAVGEAKKLRVVPKENQTGGQLPAQIMFVVGSDAGGSSNPNWTENLKLAIKLQEKLNEIYPGITRPILLSKKRYNQHIVKGSLIVEVGGDGNTIKEVTEATKYLAAAVDAVIQ